MFYVFHVTAIPDILFKFTSEMADRRSYGPCSGFAEGTNRLSFDLALNIPQQIDVAYCSVAVKNFVQDFLHPSSSLAAGRALSAAFVVIKPCKVPEIFYNA